MKDKVRQAGVKGKSYNYGDDFKILSGSEKSGILKTAKILLKVQQEIASLADTSLLQVKVYK
jgi:hypothetical protein